MKQYAVYKSPSDFPGKFVVHCFTVRDGDVWPDEKHLSVSDTLEEARSNVPAGLVNMGRAAGDEETMLEVWI